MLYFLLIIHIIYISKCVSGLCLRLTFLWLDSVDAFYLEQGVIYMGCRGSCHNGAMEPEGSLCYVYYKWHMAGYIFCIGPSRFK